MCVIVDTNKLSSFLQEPADADSRPLRDWVTKRGGHIIYSVGDKFRDELQGEARKALVNYARRGKATPIAAADVEKEIRLIQGAPDCKSDDFHILALARASGARLLYTADQNLIADFKNKKIIDKPRGKVYSSAQNKNLLRANICNR